MRYTIGYALVIGFFVLIFLSDFYLSQIFKRAIYQINQQAKNGFGIKPISVSHICLITTLLWLPPLLLTTTSMKLEYRLLLTPVYWLPVCFGFWRLATKKTSPEMANRILPYLLGIGFSAGLFLLPAVILIRDAILG